MRVYLAARYSRMADIRLCKEDLERIGHTVTSRWLDGTHGESFEATTPEDHARYCLEDLSDIDSADLLIFFAEPPRIPSTNRGGRHVEMGYALARGLPVVVHGYQENVFHSHPGVTFFGDWPDVMEHMRHLPRRMTL